MARSQRKASGRGRYFGEFAGPGGSLAWTRSPSSALSHPFVGWEGSPTKIDYRKRGTLILTSLLEDLVEFAGPGGSLAWMFGQVGTWVIARE